MEFLTFLKTIIIASIVSYDPIQAMMIVFKFSTQKSTITDHCIAIPNTTSAIATVVTITIVIPPH